MRIVAVSGLFVLNKIHYHCFFIIASKERGNAENTIHVPAGQ
jgi:hypothetical protein